MDTHSLPPNERVTLYQERAQALRRLATAEPLGTAREQMLALAEEFRYLAESLKTQLGL